MAASLIGWKARRRLLGGLTILAVGLALTGCGGGGVASGPAPKNIQDEIKAGQKAGVEQYLKNRPAGPGGTQAPGGPPGAPGAPPGPPPAAPR